MPLLRLAVTARRHQRALRLLAGLIVMAALFAMLLSAVEPVHAHGCGDAQTSASSAEDRLPAPADARPPAGRR